MAAKGAGKKGKADDKPKSEFSGVAVIDEALKEAAERSGLRTREDAHTRVAQWCETLLGRDMSYLEENEAAIVQEKSVKESPADFLAKLADESDEGEDVEMQPVEEPRPQQQLLRTHTQTPRRQPPQAQAQARARARAQARI